MFQRTMLNESAIQKPTKFQGPHFRRSGSTGETHQVVGLEVFSEHMHTWLQVVIRQHQLGISQARLGLDGELVDHPCDLGPLDGLHLGLSQCLTTVLNGRWME